MPQLCIVITTLKKLLNDSLNAVSRQVNCCVLIPYSFSLGLQALSIRNKKQQSLRIDRVHKSAINYHSWYVLCITLTSQLIFSAECSKSLLGRKFAINEQI